jgi:hypothetical protein
MPHLVQAAQMWTRPRRPCPFPPRLGCHLPCLSHCVACQLTVVITPMLTSHLLRLDARTEKCRALDVRDCLKTSPLPSLFFLTATPQASSHSHPPPHLPNVHTIGHLIVTQLSWPPVLSEQCRRSLSSSVLVSQPSFMTSSSFS